MNFVDPMKVESRYNMTSSNHLFPSPKYTGPVPNILDTKGNEYAATPYKLTPTTSHVFGDTNRRDLIGHQHTSTPLNEVFFSQGNIDSLQKQIQEQVSLMSGGKFRIGNQDEQQLKFIMRSYYLMYAQNNAANVANELDDLNRRVIGYSSGKIYSEVDFHEFYVKDLAQFPDPIANPMNVGVYGTRTGELKSFF
uniref:Minor capsid protein P8 central region domain-containing protein n=1 Tax=viral metagenome TaxID=1070528 RepID=A0A6C0K182_9ZZZZ